MSQNTMHPVPTYAFGADRLERDDESENFERE